jgi:predicted 3-demethylubiquinone-9 3-methyltransferase (glyoxalase superfamily)
MDPSPSPDAMHIRSVAPLLVFQGDASEALEFYASLFPGAQIERVERFGEEEPAREGSVEHATLRIADLTLEVIDSPPVHEFTFAPSISLAVECDAAEAVDALYERLADGGRVFMELNAYLFSPRYAWVADRFGVSWQLRARRP